MTQRSRFVAALLVVLVLAPMAAQAGHRHHYHRHSLLRFHSPVLHYYPVAPAVVGATPVAVTAANPGKLYTFPAQGQTPAQQANDRFMCHEWAVGQSGFDPVAAASAPVGGFTSTGTSPVAPSDPLRGAAGGAALGALGGAIAGDPGMGAAIGAAVGGTVGLANQSSRQARSRHHAAAVHNAQADYRRAMSACMVGKGYTVS